MIQIRNVPDSLHRRLKSRAALAGMSLSDYLLSEIREVAERPTLDELRSRLQGRSRITPSLWLFAPSANAGDRCRCLSAARSFTAHAFHRSGRKAAVCYSRDIARSSSSRCRGGASHSSLCRRERNKQRARTRSARRSRRLSNTALSARVSAVAGLGTSKQPYGL